jgi:hypothetical protein
MLDLVHQPDNAQIIRYEIEAAHDKYGRQGDDPTILALPLPFVSFLMGQALAVDLEDQEHPYTSMVRIIQPVATDFSGGMCTI